MAFTPSYIVQIKNPNRFTWHELPITNCRFRSIDKAKKLHDEILTSPMYAGMQVRVWQPAAQDRVYFNS